MRVIRIFLSSPGDCTPERNVTHEIVATLNADPIISGFAKVEVVAWDWAHGIPFDALYTPQTSVNTYLPTPEECDVFIGISRCRFGTPLPTGEFRKEDGTPFQSGSEYEFDRAWKSRRQGAALPVMLMYRSTDLLGGKCPDNEQSRRTKAFFESPPFKDQEGWTGSVTGFESTEDYRTLINSHLRKILSQWHPTARQPLKTWLAKNASRLSHDAGPRYTKGAHLDSDFPEYFDWLLMRPNAINSIDSLLQEVWKNIDGISDFSDLQVELAQFGEHFIGNPHWEEMPNFEHLVKILSDIGKLAWERVEQNNTDTEAAYQRHRLITCGGRCNDAIEIITKYETVASKRILLISGHAGQGKTHTLVHEVNNILSDGGIAVGVLCQTLSASDDLLTALQRRWDFDGNLQQFLDSLENAAVQLNQRALIVVDALNETPNRKRWKHELSGLLSEILARPHLTAALSVRTDYLRHVLPQIPTGSPTPWVKVNHPGFSGVEPEALLEYCKHYGVQVPVAPPIGELENPLYVQLFVKSLQNIEPTHHWIPSWLEVWSAWMDKLEEDAIGAIDLEPSRPRPIHRTLKQLAKAMLECNQFHLTRDNAEEIARKIAGNGNIIGFLCSAGALIDRIEEDEDIVEYGFERLSDTFFIDCLLRQLFKGTETKEQRKKLLDQALSPGGILFRLTKPSSGSDILSLRRAGLLEALCLATPAKTGVEIPHFIPLNTPNSDGSLLRDWELERAFTDSFRWRCNPTEFTLPANDLWHLWKSCFSHTDHADQLDELIRLSLIPRHPFALEHKLHPWLADMHSPGERDSVWSILLVELWQRESSCLKSILRWATEANLNEVVLEIALPIAKLLAWTCAVSQNSMRKAAIQGLTRILVACPTCLPKLLPDFLTVDDAYILEAVLIATWGVVIDGRQPQPTADASKLVHDSMFPGGNAKWCHLTIRHYSRQIVEDAFTKGWLPDTDLSAIRPPYRSSLPLDKVPDEEALRKFDTSSGFSSICGSALGRDFYWYVMGATSGPKPFTSTPLPHSKEPIRAYVASSSSLPNRQPSSTFDIPLAARYVVWNCLQLGWTSGRFNEFDTGPSSESFGRISPSGRTERIGKKYQWIGWQTMLGFLADNYEMRPSYNTSSQHYDSPHQISYIEVFDPSRWLQDSGHKHKMNRNDAFWKIPSMPHWPRANREAIQEWATNTSCDLPPIDVISTIPDNLPEHWGKGPWMRIAAEKVWCSNYAPGSWAQHRDYSADIWWQIVPTIIKANDLPTLITTLQDSTTKKHLAGLGRYDFYTGYDTPLTEWPSLSGDFNRGFELDPWDWSPIQWMPLAGISGNADSDTENGEDGEVIIPWPRLFREWDLTLDLRNGVVRHGEEVVFGLAGWTMGETALFARTDILMELLANSRWSLVWLINGERRAWLDLEDFSDPDSYAWVDTTSIAYLGKDQRIHTACHIREKRRKE